MHFWNKYKYFIVLKRYRLVLLKHIVITTDIHLDLVQKGHEIGIVPNSGKSINFIQI